MCEMGVASLGGTRFVAADSNMTTLPSPLIEASLESRSPGTPAAPPARLAKRVVTRNPAVCRTNTSRRRLTSSLTRLLALLSNATLKPLSLIEGCPEGPLARAPERPLARLTRDVDAPAGWPGDEKERT